MTPPASSLADFPRRYDLDWLRIIAFGLLIFYHIGMYYVTWEWHLKSPHAGDFAEPVMILVNPWRLSLLFFISGVALRFASDKMGAAPYTLNRLWRLGVPVVFGMFVLVMPQSYYQLRYSGEIGPEFWPFYWNYADFQQTYSIITPTWNHLWYVAYLLVYTLLLAPLLPLLRMVRPVTDRVVGFVSGGATASWRVLMIPAVPFVIYRFTLSPYFPVTHDLVADWANHAISFTILMVGFFAAKSDAFWAAVRRVFPVAAGLFIVSAIVLSYFWAIWETLTEDSLLMEILRAWRIWYAWLAIVTLIGFAQRFLNKPSTMLTYMTGSIFSWYIFHQTITVSAGFYLGQMDLSLGEEFALITIATIGGCFIGTEIVRRIPVLRICFGLKG